MAELNIEDIILLIHGEIATAVTSAEIYGNSPGIKLSNVRVRMGQEWSSLDGADNAISLNTERFPPAKNGWLIDVSYSPSEYKAPSASSEQTEVLPSTVLNFLGGISVHKIKGIVSREQKALHHIKINTIQELANIEPTEMNFKKLFISHMQFRRLQSVALLTLSIPITPIPISLLNIKFNLLLDRCWSGANDSRLKALSDGTKNQITRWLQQLELCLEQNYFNSLTFKQMLD